jgi:hypothetical protein
MNPNQLISVPEAQRRIHDPELTHEKGKALAAATLMECCEHDLHITLDDMLRCLDYGGGIASMGARCLYVRTGRDGLGWKTASGCGFPFVMDRADWEMYLREQHLHSVAEQSRCTEPGDDVAVPNRTPAAPGL